jgi:hypothetical protein
MSQVSVEIVNQSGIGNPNDFISAKFAHFQPNKSFQTPFPSSKE